MCMERIITGLSFTRSWSNFGFSYRGSNSKPESKGRWPHNSIHTYELDDETRCRLEELGRDYDCCEIDLATFLAGIRECVDLRSVDALSLAGFDSATIPIEFCTFDLKGLYIDNFSHMLTLPGWLASQKSLKYLEINSSPKFKTLPDWITEIKSLEELELVNLPSLTKLPANLKQLANMKLLVLEHLPKLSKLPNKLDQLTQLYMISAEGLTGLKTLPKGLCNSEDPFNMDSTKELLQLLQKGDGVNLAYKSKAEIKESQLL